MINANEAKEKTKESISKRIEDFEKNYPELITMAEKGIKKTIELNSFSCSLHFAMEMTSYEKILLCDYLESLGYTTEIPCNYVYPPIIVSWGE